MMSDPYITIGNIDSFNKYTETLKKGKPSKKDRTDGLISVVVLTWNRCEYLASIIQAFRNFVKHIEEPNVKIEYISIDNGSTNRKIFEILGRYPWDIKIHNKNNMGIRHALDQAFSRSTGEHILCLEDDWLTLAKKPFLKPCMRIMKRWGDIGGVRLKENLQLGVERRIEDGQVKLFPIKEKMDQYELRWRGKYTYKGWFDIRTTDENDEFYTWSGNDKSGKGQIFANGGFLMRGSAYDSIGPFAKSANEFGYGKRFQSHYNVAILKGEERFRHLGINRSKGSWHE